jgi:uncharacterized protein YndB with AHSA1/START domain
MKYALIVLAALLALVLIIVAVGAMLPVKHRASRQVKLHQTPEKVFAVINDPASFPAWRGKVKRSREMRVEILPDRGGHRMFRETGPDGTILYEVVSVAANKSLVTRIADPSLPFGGKWTYELFPEGDSTILRITEDGEVYNPVFRFASRFIFGHSATIDQYLHDIAKRFGEDSAAVTPAIDSV